MLAYDRDLVFDLGAHKGDLTEQAVKAGFGKIVAVEAVPEYAEFIRNRFTPGAGVHVVEGAVTANTTYKLPFYLSDVPDGQTSSIYADRVKQPKQEALMVYPVSYQKLTQKFGVPFYLKSDLEGADCELLQAMLVWSPETDRPPYLSVELCANHDADTLEIFAALDRMGYVGFAFARQQHGIEPLCYPWATTRLFWLTLEEAIVKWFSGSLPETDGTWYDLHAFHKESPTGIRGVKAVADA